MMISMMGNLPKARTLPAGFDDGNDAPGFRYENIEIGGGQVVRYCSGRDADAIVVRTGAPPPHDPYGVIATAARANAIYQAMAQARAHASAVAAAPPAAPKKKERANIEFDEPPAAVGRRMTTVEVDDPNPDARRVVRDEATGALKLITPRVRARANIAHDVLAAEFDAGRISKEAFSFGRDIEAVLARAQAGSGGQWREGDRVDAASAHEHAIAIGIDAANEAVALRYAIRVAVGWRMATAISLVLGEGLDLSQMAKAMSRSDRKRDRKYYAQLFRDGLEDYAESQTKVARGAVRPSCGAPPNQS